VKKHTTVLTRAHTRVLLALLAILALPSALHAVEPIFPAPCAGWPMATYLRNDKIEVAVAPQAGRLIHVGWRKSFNVLRLDHDLAGTSFMDADPPPAFVNLGGAWLWPIGQGWWPSIAGADWPPPPVLAEADWEADAGREPDGTEWCAMSRSYGKPLSVAVTRRIALIPGESRFTIDQRAERTEQSDLPVALWSVTQLDNPFRVFLPVDEGKDLTLLMGDPPDPRQIEAIDGIRVFTPDKDAPSVKLGSGSSRAWIAAQCKNVLILQKMRSRSHGGVHPDGCTVEAYVDTGQGYTEIETLSTEHYLAPGEVVENTVYVELHLLPVDVKPREAVERVKALVGE
jgi:hypothetical protein